MGITDLQLRRRGIHNNPRSCILEVSTWLGLETPEWISRQKSYEQLTKDLNDLGISFEYRCPRTYVSMPFHFKRIITAFLYTILFQTLSIMGFVHSGVVAIPSQYLLLPAQHLFAVGAHRSPRVARLLLLHVFASSSQPWSLSWQSIKGFFSFLQTAPVLIVSRASMTSQK
jgi:hypothetical protein